MRLLESTQTTSKAVGGGNAMAHVFRFQVKSIGATTLTPEGSCDGGTTWVGVGVRKATDDSMATSITANGIYEVDVSGMLFRLTASGAAAVVDGELVIG